MKNNKYFGWKEVCRFTYVQSMKSKAMKITLAILCVIAILAFPLISMITSSDEETSAKSAVETVYLYSNKEVLADYYTKGLADENYKHISFEKISKADFDKMQKKLENADKDCKNVLVNILYDEDYNSINYGMEYHIIYGKQSGVTEDDVQGLVSVMMEEKNSLLLNNETVDAGVMEELLRSNYYEISTIDENGNNGEIDDGLDSMEYAISYAWLMISMFVIIIAGSKIAELIVTEKTSKVMEYLLTTIRPLALLLGKLVSALLIVLSMLGAIMISLVISIVINKIIFGGNLIPESITRLFADGVMANLNPLTVLISLLITLAGYVFYELLAGLAGATVGKVEELAEGLKIFTFTMVIGVYMGIILMSASSAGAAMGAYGKFVCLFPLSSVFVAPAYLLIGKITLLEAVISFALLVVVAFLMWKFVSAIFEHILYHNSNVLKMKDILSLYKETRGGRHGKEE